MNTVVIKNIIKKIFKFFVIIIFVLSNLFSLYTFYYNKNVNDIDVLKNINIGIINLNRTIDDQ